MAEKLSVEVNIFLSFKYFCEMLLVHTNCNNQIPTSDSSSKNFLIFKKTCHQSVKKHYYLIDSSGPSLACALYAEYWFIAF
jgi:hypothetical protein